ncbi:Mannosyl-oligosaccharide alpha-1,2-mannosidase isoform A [Folsomia candida]|uniref:alpha-1,2-Mannosidase n=1 Tax=Folsomia candida TaxID=158441 RepID=A0A226DP86_FOLCA|nr:Mannosyl-oligosaccharide alpha-1,2-mannosidase isoform A [Folsomia candida]
MKVFVSFLILGCLNLIAMAWAIPVRQDATSNLENGKAVITQGREGEDPDPVIRARREFVKQMMKDAWDDYVMWAWEDNELKPVSQTGQHGDIFGDSRIGATIVDSLDTLYIMEMMEEYETARGFVANQLDLNVNATVSVFETNIRFVGGFLSAYALTQDTIYRDRALEIATKLLPAFDTPTGIPYSHVNVLTGEPRNNVESVLAEFGTLHLEFVYLSEITGNPIFREKVETIRQFLKQIEKPNGLYPNHLHIFEGRFTDDHVSIGALGDSYYEYLLKAAIQLNDGEGRMMYDEAMDGFFNNGLVKVSRQNHLLYIAESRGGQIQDVVGHLACFAGGMFVLGAHVDPSNSNAVRDAEVGKNFTTTCHESYIRTATQIGPEVFQFTETLEAEAGNDE